MPQSPNHARGLLRVGGVVAGLGFVLLAYGLAFRYDGRPQTGGILVGLALIISGIVVAGYAKSAGKPRL